MKKIYTFLTVATMAVTMVAFTACGFTAHFDDGYYGNDYADSEEALTLNGTWTGYIDTYYRDRFGLYGDSYRTTMYFERENPYGGWGYEVDYNVNSRYENYYYCDFRWEVIDGAIRIQYSDSWNDVWIYDYRLQYNYFAGYMDDGVSNSRIRFQLNYDSSFDWGYWRGSSTRGTDEAGFKASGEFAK